MGVRIMDKNFSLAFGEEQVTFTVPEEQLLDIVEGKEISPIIDVPEAIHQALTEPIGSPGLSTVVKSGDHVVIVVSDITRQWIRYDLILPTLIAELNTAGIVDRDITLIVALGAHRPHTDQENAEIYGKEIVDRIAIKQSYALNDEDFVPVGKTARGVNVRLNREVVEADKVILTGGIIYHSMAGFGGGRKSVLPGIAAYDTIQGNHRFCLNKIEGQGLNPYCYAGSLEHNEMHQDMLEMAEMLQPDFLLNAVYTPKGEFCRFVAGHWYDAWLTGCKTVEELYGIPISGKADIVVTSSGGFPKDINFYQASKAIENAYEAVKDEGVLITLMECREIGDPPDFSQWFDYSSPIECEAELRKAFTVPGFVALKMRIIAKTMKVIVVTLPENRKFIEKMGMIAAENMAEAFTLANKIVDKKLPSVTVIPHGGIVFPIIK